MVAALPIRPEAAPMALLVVRLVVPALMPLVVVPVKALPRLEMVLAVLGLRMPAAAMAFGL